MKKLAIIITLLFFTLKAFTQYSPLVDREREIEEIKLNAYYLDYRQNLKPNKISENFRSYEYSRKQPLYYQGLRWDDILLGFEKDDRLKSIILTKYVSESETSNNPLYPLLTQCISIFDTKPVQKDIDQADRGVFQFTWYGDKVTFEIYHTMYKNLSKGEILSIMISVKK